jgi:hypothetical protein
MKTFLKKLYIFAFMALTVFFMVVIWNLTFGKLLGMVTGREGVNQTEMAKPREDQKKDQTFKKIMLESDEKVKHYLGYRVLEEMKIEGHFHHIDYDMEPDNRSYCIECHGDIPHQKTKEIRAFANMHSAFLACETCHVRLEGEQKTGVFKWYSRKTGEIIPSPIQEGVAPGLFHAKIIPFEMKNGNLQRIDDQSQIDFARKYLRTESTLTEDQKADAKKKIHKRVAKNPYLCEDCHRSKDPLIPFEKIGYSKKRANLLVSNEVVGMIRDYTEFYVPEILHPGLSDSEAAEGGKKDDSGSSPQPQ